MTDTPSTGSTGDIRVLFLDVDGVVMLFNNRGVFDAGCMNQLKRVVTETNAKVVLSST